MSEQNHYIVDLKRLPVGTHLFDFQLDNDFFSSLEKSEILSGEVVAKAVLNLRGGLSAQHSGSGNCLCCVRQMPRSHAP